MRKRLNRPGHTASSQELALLSQLKEMAHQQRGGGSTQDVDQTAQ
jgi:hypothetical protein